MHFSAEFGDSFSRTSPRPSQKTFLPPLHPTSIATKREDEEEKNPKRTQRRGNEATPPPLLPPPKRGSKTHTERKKDKGKKNPSSPLFPGKGKVAALVNSASKAFYRTIPTVSHSPLPISFVDQGIEGGRKGEPKEKRGMDSIDNTEGREIKAKVFDFRFGATFISFTCCSYTEYEVSYIFCFIVWRYRCGATEQRSAETLREKKVGISSKKSPKLSSSLLFPHPLLLPNQSNLSVGGERERERERERNPWSSTGVHANGERDKCFFRGELDKIVPTKHGQEQ